MVSLLQYLQFCLKCTQYADSLFIQAYNTMEIIVDVTYLIQYSQKNNALCSFQDKVKIINGQQTNGYP